MDSKHFCEDKVSDVNTSNVAVLALAEVDEHDVVARLWRPSHPNKNFRHYSPLRDQSKGR
jgi:hypothetical protein